MTALQTEDHRTPGVSFPGRSALAIVLGTIALAVATPGSLVADSDSPERDSGREFVQAVESDRATESELNLALQDAVRIAFENNIDISLIRYRRDQSRQAVTVEDGEFDPELFLGTPPGPTLVRPESGGFVFGSAPGGLGFSTSEEPTFSQLAGADVIDSDNFGFLAAVSQRFPFGLRYEVGYGVSRYESNSDFNSLNPSYSNTLTFSVFQPLLQGFGKEASAERLLLARRNAEAGDARFRQQVEATLLEVEEAYWELVLAEREIEVRRQSLELAREQLERTRAHVDVGLLSDVEITQAEAAVARRESDLIVAENAVESARDRLRALLRADRLSDGWMTRLVPTDEPEFAARNVDLEEAVQRALEVRPEVAEARAEIAARGVEVDAARSGTLPRLDLMAAMGSTGIGGDLLIRDELLGPVVGIEEGGYGDAAARLFDFDFLTWSVGVTLRYPIFNRSAKADYARATLAEDEAKARLQGLQQRVVLDVRRAIRDLESADRRVEATRKSLELARRQLENEQGKFDVGLSTNFEVLQLQEDFSRAQIGEFRALVDHELAEARLGWATGSLFDRFGIELRTAGE